jgi:hypothetical protein
LSLLTSNTLLNTISSSTLNLRSSPSVTGRYSHQYKIESKIISVYHDFNTGGERKEWQ